MTTNLFSRFLRTVLMVCALAVSSHAAADAMYLVSLDTSKLGNNVPGALDFVFAGPGTPSATATMSWLNGFDPAGFDAPIGDVAAVPGGFTFQNTANYNSVYYNAMFGNTLSFVLTLAGDFTGNDLSGFAILAYDDMGGLLSDTLLNLAFTTGQDGEILAFPLALDQSAASVAALAVPEPGALALAGLGLLMLGVARRQRRA